MWNVYMCKDESRDDRQNFDLLVYLYNCHLIKHAKKYAAEGPFLPVWTEAHHMSTLREAILAISLPQNLCHSTSAATTPVLQQHLQDDTSRKRTHVFRGENPNFVAISRLTVTDCDRSCGLFRSLLFQALAGGGRSTPRPCETAGRSHGSEASS